MMYPHRCLDNDRPYSYYKNYMQTPMLILHSDYMYPLDKVYNWFDNDKTHHQYLKPYYTFQYMSLRRIQNMYLKILNMSDHIFRLDRNTPHNMFDANSNKTRPQDM